MPVLWSMKKPLSNEKYIARRRGFCEGSVGGESLSCFYFAIPPPAGCARVTAPVIKTLLNVFSRSGPSFWSKVLRNIVFCWNSINHLSTSHETSSGIATPTNSNFICLSWPSQVFCWTLKNICIPHTTFVINTLNLQI